MSKKFIMFIRVSGETERSATEYFPPAERVPVY